MILIMPFNNTYSLNKIVCCQIYNCWIIADHPLDREIITKLKNGLYDIELENNEVVSSSIRNRQEWSLPEYDALPFKKAVEREGVGL